MDSKNIITIEEYAEVLKKGIGKVYINEWATHMVGPKWPKPIFAMNKEVTWDGIRHFVDGIGDLNPLYRDREYAAKTRYSCLIAPPSYLATMSSAVNYPDPPGFLPLPDFPLFVVGKEHEWFSPLCEGDEIDWKTTFPTNLQIRDTQSMGKMIFMNGITEYTRHRGGIPVAISRFAIAVYKGAPVYENRLKTDKKPVYTKEYIKNVYAAQDKEIVRGAEPRYWEDVNVGEELTPVVRGPYTAMDSVADIRGCVGEEWHYSSGRLYRLAQEHCGWGIYDPDLKIYHSFKDNFDSNIGGAVYSGHRYNLLVMLLTNWMGDDGFLWKCKSAYQRQTALGCVLWCKGKVSKKYSQDGRYCVDIDCSIEDQTGIPIQPSTATVLLPSRDHGQVFYPAPHPVV
jgi:hypothetical protein